MLVEIGRRELAKSGTDERHRAAGHLRGHQAAQRLGRQERRRSRSTRATATTPRTRCCAESGSLSVAGVRRPPPTAASPDPSTGWVAVAAGQPEVQLTLLVTSPRVAPGLLSWSGVVGGRRAPRDGWPPRRTRRWPARSPPPGHPVDVLPGASVAALLARPPATTTWCGWPTTPRPSRSRRGSRRRARRRRRRSPQVEVLHASYDVPGARLLDLVTVMDRLRTECPWDREQTHRSLARYLLEETYETLEAIEGSRRRTTRTCARSSATCCCRCTSTPGSPPSTPRTASPSTTSPPASSTSWCTGTRTCSRASTSSDADEVERNWETLKAAEKGRASVLDGIPPGAAGARAGRQGARPGRQGRGRPERADRDRQPGRPAARPRRGGPRRRPRRRAGRSATPSAGSADAVRLPEPG